MRIRVEEFDEVSLEKFDWISKFLFLKIRWGVAQELEVKRKYEHFKKVNFSFG